MRAQHRSRDTNLHSLCPPGQIQHRKSCAARWHFFPLPVFFCSIQKWAKACCQCTAGTHCKGNWGASLADLPAIVCLSIVRLVGRPCHCVLQCCSLCSDALQTRKHIRAVREKKVFIFRCPAIDSALRCWLPPPPPKPKCLVNLCLERERERGNCVLLCMTQLWKVQYRVLPFSDAKGLALWMETSRTFATAVIQTTSQWSSCHRCGCCRCCRCCRSARQKPALHGHRHLTNYACFHFLYFKLPLNFPTIKAL